MKHLLTTILLLCALTINAQTTVVTHTAKQQPAKVQPKPKAPAKVPPKPKTPVKVQPKPKAPVKVQPSPKPKNKPNTGSAAGHEWVDLALPSGTLWATCNVGASNPEEYGDYFAWGETKPKFYYDWSSYFDTTDNGATFKKYNNNGGKTKLDLSDDAAYVNWGSGWCMPSREQLDELREKCLWTWTSKNGVIGLEAKSKYNGHTIFLPAAGSRKNDCLSGDGASDPAAPGGSYWLCSLDERNPSFANYIFFFMDFVGCEEYCRYEGRPVRPVRGNQANNH